MSAEPVLVCYGIPERPRFVYDQLAGSNCSTVILEVEWHDAIHHVWWDATRNLVRRAEQIHPLLPPSDTHLLAVSRDGRRVTWSYCREVFALDLMDQEAPLARISTAGHPRMLGLSWFPNTPRVLIAFTRGVLGAWEPPGSELVLLGEAPPREDLLSPKNAAVFDALFPLRPGEAPPEPHAHHREGVVPALWSCAALTDIRWPDRFGQLLFYKLAAVLGRDDQLFVTQCASHGHERLRSTPDGVVSMGRLAIHSPSGCTTTAPLLLDALQLIVIGTEVGISIHAATTGAFLRAYIEHGHTTFLTLSPDGSLLVSCHDDDSRVVRSWVMAELVSDVYSLRWAVVLHRALFADGRALAWRRIKPRPGLAEVRGLMQPLFALDDSVFQRVVSYLA